ncbi:hypothetical protein HK096_008754, partial [Nowakowskiella sp. JEL0078]
MTRNGIGVGGVVGTLRHFYSPMLWGEISGSMGQSSSVSGKLVKNFSSDSFINVHATATSLTNPPPLTFVLGRRLAPSLTGFLTFKTGSYTLESLFGLSTGESESSDQSACSLGILKNSEKSQWSVDVQAGLGESHISGGYFRSFWKRNVRLRISVGLSTQIGLTVSLAGDKKVSKHTKVGMGVDCAAMGGVSFKLRVIRLGQKFVIPILLTPEYDFNILFWAAVIPVCTTAAVDRFIFLPRRKKQLLKTLKQVRNENAEILGKRRKEAKEAIRLMREGVKRKVDFEEAKNGLLIIEAFYGKLPSIPKGSPSHSTQHLRNFLTENETGVGRSQTDLADDNKPFVDVTVAVMSLVNNSQLHITGGHTKAHMVGFCDPCLGETKKLRVTYKFQGHLHRIEVDDTAALAAPLR